MRVVVASSRFPWPPYTGDRLRATVWIEALSGHHEVTLIAPAGEKADGVVVIGASRSAVAMMRAGWRVASEGLPIHALIAAGRDWREAMRRAIDQRGPFDAAVFGLSRFEPWIGESLQAPWRVIDAIDSLAASTSQRSAASHGPMKSFWSAESRRTARLESALSRRYDRVVLVNAAEGPYFGGQVDVIPNGVDIFPPSGRPFESRRYDCGFWGRLGYFANIRAVERLLALWPEIRRRKSDATLLIAGADAPRAIRARHGRDGITVLSPMERREQLLREVKIAFFPFAFGSGQSNKVLEAGEASCAVVATPQALRGAEALHSSARISSDESRLVDDVVSLLKDPDTAHALAERGRAAVVEHYGRDAVREMMRRVITGGRA